MLKQLCDFREMLDEMMLPALYKRVILYGYESYTGRFLKWYAKYYHGIEIDYLIDTNMPRGVGHTQIIYTPDLLTIDYKDVKDAIIWLAEPLTEKLKRFFENNGYVNAQTYFDFFEKIYAKDIMWEVSGGDIFVRKKQGRKDIQFLEWLEWKFDCNFVTRIPRENMEVVGEHGFGYACTTQMEIFPILDACHCKPKAEDAIFDFGCGKGGAIVSFLDYGFERAGGVEFEPKVYHVLEDNMEKLGIGETAEILYGDAAKLRIELDKYNWFYFNAPFDGTIFAPVIQNICESYMRQRRKIYVILKDPNYRSYIENSGIFRLFIQPTIDTRRRVVNVYETF